jgi:alpha-L-arabinofuranosidase
MLKDRRRATIFVALGVMAALWVLPESNFAQTFAGRGRGGPPTLGLADGTVDFDTPDFTLKLVKDSQTIAALQPKGAEGYRDAPFDFTPADQIQARAADGYNHLGDITFRVREGDAGPWTAYSTAMARKPVTALPAGGNILAAADLAATLPENCPLQITRSWRIDSTNRLVLHFDIKNKSQEPVTLGALGFPVIFNNLITGRTLEQAHGICCFFDPYVGQDGGYLQVTRLNGSGPALIVVAETGTKTPFEAYRKINDRTQTSQTFEGAFEWMVHSQAYAENQWRNAREWNPATSETLLPGQTVSHGLRFLVAPEIRAIEQTLTANGRPVVVGIPGYIVPMDLDARLFVNPAGRKITDIQSDPAGALEMHAEAPTSGGWLTYTIHGKVWGRARLTITYDDGSQQAVHYYVTKPAYQAVADLGHFLFTKQWFDEPNDPFHRSPSVMSYDRGKDKIVTQDSRVWIAGLGDEGGSSWLTAAMKEFVQPNKAEVDKFAQFVDQVLWGQLQVSAGDQMYAVRKSLFYYDQPNLPDFKYDPAIRWSPGFPSWNRQAAFATDRGYDYPHVVAAYWAMYRLARNNPGLVTAEKWQWYLDHAYQTTRYLAAGRGGGPGYTEFGLMEGDVFLFLLEDLKREGWTEQAGVIEAAMKRRADRWNSEAFPFGSEMAWDSTGQEEVYAWTQFFGYQDKAQVSLDSILGYMPTIPHWGYNGNARRYWDFQYGGAPGEGIERQLHHYGSGINAIPVLSEYRRHPEDYYLLRIGYGGFMGALSNIDQEGFASAAFHSYPQTLKWDAYSGDYGPNFFGHAADAATYVIDHPEFGWQAFGGNIKLDGDWVDVQPLDAMRRRIYIAPLGLYLTLDAGTFEGVAIDTNTHAIRLTLSAASQFTPQALLRIEQPAAVQDIGKFAPSKSFTIEREAFVIPLDVRPTLVELAMLPGHRASEANPGHLTVHVDQPGVKMSPTFYGLMTEEINHSYDGGLYGELIQNRIFKDAGGSRRRRGAAGAPANGSARHWSLVNSDGAQGAIALDTTDPVNATALSSSLRLDITAIAGGQRVGVANDGFWGIPVHPATKYTASFYAKASADFSGPLTVDIESEDGATTFASARIATITPGWQQYFVISAASKGSVWFNLVSLFPPTYQDRPNGNRVDIMEDLAGLHPGFLRLPGGNYLEGNTIAERFDWKKTIGPLDQRPGHQCPWGYRSSDGLGLLEFLEWCEDLKMEPVLAVYGGYSLQQQRIAAGAPLQPYVQDALDEIEYVTGDRTTRWGAERAKDGHPDPFKLSYVEIGNEDNFDGAHTYDQRFSQFFDAIRAKYPDLQLIASAPGLVHSRRPDVVDDHVYLAPLLLEQEAHRHDLTPRDGPKIFMGEWASQDGSPTPTMNSALADAAFLTGLERNADIVVMECYAPLLVNVNPGASQWGTNLIGYNGLSSFGSPSYYAQKMFAENRGNRVLPIDVAPQATAATREPSPHGAIGVGTWATDAQYKDIKVTSGDKTLFQSDFSDGANHWNLGTGQWQADAGTLHQSGNLTDCRATAGDSSWTDYTYTLKARKLGGAEGFLVMFHVQDEGNYLWWNVGGWGNTRTTIEKAENGEKREIGQSTDLAVESNRWYDIRIEMRGAEIKCFLDGKLVSQATDSAVGTPGPIFASSNMDDSTGDVILKVVNTFDAPQDLEITLPGARSVSKDAVADVLTGELTDTNDLDHPQKIIPHRVSITNAGNDFVHEFGSHSVTVIRLKTR